MARGDAPGYIGSANSMEEAEARAGMTFDEFLLSRGLNKTTMDPESLRLFELNFIDYPERNAQKGRDIQNDPNAVVYKDPDYRYAMNASRAEAIGAGKIPDAYEQRSSLYGGLANQFANPNSDIYADYQNNLIGQLYSQATGQGQSQEAQRMSQMLSQNAGKLGQSVQGSSLASGLNSVATNRLRGEAESNYLKSAEDQIKAASLRERSMAEQLASQAIGKQYSDMAKGAIGAAQNMANDQKSRESIGLDQLQSLLGVSDEQRRMNQILAQQAAQRRQQTIGSAANTAANIGAAALSNM